MLGVALGIPFRSGEPLMRPLTNFYRPSDVDEFILLSIFLRICGQS